MDDHGRTVERATRGDGAALDALIERHLPGLVTFVRARAGERLRRREETMDIVLSACREVLQDLDGQTGRDEASFRHWLYLEAERKILTRARYHGRDRRTPEREQALPTDGAAWSGPSPSREAAGREEWDAAEQALAGLPEDYREVILLARVVGLPHARVAESMGRSEGAVRVLLHRALSRLALALEARDPDPS